MAVEKGLITNEFEIPDVNDLHALRFLISDLRNSDVLMHAGFSNGAIHKNVVRLMIK